MALPYALEGGTSKKRGGGGGGGDDTDGAPPDVRGSTEQASLRVCVCVNVLFLSF